MRKAICVIGLVLQVKLLFCAGQNQPSPAAPPPTSAGLYRIPEIQVEADRAGKGLEGEPFPQEVLNPLEFPTPDYDVGSFLTKRSAWVRRDFSSRAAVLGTAYSSATGNASVLLLNDLITLSMFNTDLSLWPLVGLESLSLQKQASLILDASAAGGAVRLRQSRPTSDQISVYFTNSAFPVTDLEDSLTAWPLWFDQQTAGIKVARCFDRLSLSAAGSFRHAGDLWDNFTENPDRLALAAAFTANYQFNQGTIDLLIQDSRGRDGLFKTSSTGTTASDWRASLLLADWTQQNLLFPGSRLELAVAAVDQSLSPVSETASLTDSQRQQSLDLGCDLRAPLNDWLSLISRLNAGLALNQQPDPVNGDNPSTQAALALQLPIALGRALIFPTLRLDKTAAARLAPSAALSIFYSFTDHSRAWAVLSSGQRPSRGLDRQGSLDGRIVANSDLKAERDNSLSLGWALEKPPLGELGLDIDLDLSIHYRLDAIVRSWDAAIGAYRAINLDEVLVASATVAAAFDGPGNWQVALATSLTPSFVLRDAAIVYELAKAPAVIGLSLFSSKLTFTYNDGRLFAGLACLGDSGAQLDKAAEYLAQPCISLELEAGYRLGQHLTLFGTVANLLSKFDPFPTGHAPGRLELGVRWHE